MSSSPTSHKEVAAKRRAKHLFSPNNPKKSKIEDLPVKRRSLLKGLPVELATKIFSNVPFHRIIHVSQTCRDLYSKIRANRKRLQRRKLEEVTVSDSINGRAIRLIIDRNKKPILINIKEDEISHSNDSMPSFVEITNDERLFELKVKTLECGTAKMLSNVLHISTVKCLRFENMAVGSAFLQSLNLGNTQKIKIVKVDLENVALDISAECIGKFILKLGATSISLTDCGFAEEQDFIPETVSNESSEEGDCDYLQEVIQVNPQLSKIYLYDVEGFNKNGYCQLLLGLYALPITPVFVCESTDMIHLAVESIVEALKKWNIGTARYEKIACLVESDIEISSLLEAAGISSTVILSPELGDDAEVLRLRLLNVNGSKCNVIMDTLIEAIFLTFLFD